MPVRDETRGGRGKGRGRGRGREGGRANGDENDFTDMEDYEGDDGNIEGGIWEEWQCKLISWRSRR